jgi:hypothetical protein
MSAKSDHRYSVFGRKGPRSSECSATLWAKAGGSIQASIRVNAKEERFPAPVEAALYAGTMTETLPAIQGGTGSQGKRFGWCLVGGEG